MELIEKLQMKGLYVIRKCADRSMYDFQKRRVVRLSDLESIIKEKENDIVIIDSDDKDISIKILVDVFSYQVKRINGIRKLSKKDILFIKSELVQAILGLI